MEDAAGAVHSITNTYSLVRTVGYRYPGKKGTVAFAKKIQDYGPPSIIGPPGSRPLSISTLYRPVGAIPSPPPTRWAAASSAASAFASGEPKKPVLKINRQLQQLSAAFEQLRANLARFRLSYFFSA